ncbi:hypothetical protein [Rhodococcoides fascians]|uniref:hypothetical protein n=1 Tax=Rhodococcoides fascians TaxID=1828 RepID=UPI00050C4E91|nr:hypothetical protein [Rhodococcus fascians]
MAGDMDFPAGAMLTVQREAGKNVHGDAVDEDGNVVEGGWSDRHQIGPCSISSSSAINFKVGDQRAIGSITVNAPTDADVRKTDRIKLPSGHVASITSAIEYPRNPFTGWAPFLQFTIREVT